jgi:hypothetical protein
VLAIAAAGDMALVWWCRRLQPTAYRVEPGELSILRRSAPEKRFSAPVEGPQPGRLGLRLFGSGGLYGYLGIFRLAGGGRVRAYVTDLGRVAIFRAGDESVAISPAAPIGDPDA